MSAGSSILSQFVCHHNRKVSLNPPRNPDKWWRAGAWEIQWSRAEDFWRCNRKISDSDGYRLPPAEYYDPLKETPEAYLSFAALGRLTWESFGGEHIGYRWNLTDIPQTVQEAVVQFHVDFGPPIIDRLPPRPPPSFGVIVPPDVLDVRSYLENVSDKSPDYRPLQSVDMMLKQAQLIDILVEYQQVVTTREKADRETLRTRLLAVDRSADIWNLGSMSTLNEVAAAAERVLHFWESYDINLGGLRLDALPIGSTGPGEPWPPLLIGSAPPDEPLGWEFSWTYDQLLSVIWFQGMQAIVRGSLIRSCRNNQCRLGLFEAERTNSFYCSTRCRNLFNTAKHRRRQKPRTIADILP